LNFITRGFIRIHFKESYQNVEKQQDFIE